MNVNWFRQIGYIYAVLCLFGSMLGAVYFFRKIFEPDSYCDKHYCEKGFNHAMVSVTGVVVCLVSASITMLVKLGLDQCEIGYIQIGRTFMLVRSLFLTIRWTYESVALTIAEIGQAVPVVDDQFRSLILLLVVGVKKQNS
ncbi:uncharacterized protein LOC134214989 [Armigeres subalbatus]|uniref:uncharacterized protein LOC134214989 n=1 Tax=Armigeres subalbatus TaxID=124917 RepID=UPI002ED1FB42